MSNSPKRIIKATGGIVVGQLGRFPMALTDDPIVGRGGSLTYEYTGYHIWGFPRRASGGNFSVGPVVAPTTRIEASEWIGTIPIGGCQFWLIETYDENVVSFGGGSYGRDGTVTAVGTPYITTRSIGNTDDPGSRTLYMYDANVPRVTLAWLLSVVYEDSGVYYLARRALPTQGGDPDAFPVPTYPEGYITDFPL